MRQCQEIVSNNLHCSMSWLQQRSAPSENVEICLARSTVLLQCDRKERYEKVWARPLIKVAHEYGVCAAALGKTCRKLQVPVPGRGYWAKPGLSRRGDNRLKTSERGENDSVAEPLFAPKPVSRARIPSCQKPLQRRRRKRLKGHECKVPRSAAQKHMFSGQPRALHAASRPVRDWPRAPSLSADAR